MRRHQPALLGGLFIGVLSVLPFVGAANICCCLWGVTGGILTVYLQQQRQEAPVDTVNAVLGGLIAGLIGGLIFVISMLFTMDPSDPARQDEMMRTMERILGEGVSPEVRDQMTAFANSSMFRAAMGGIWLLTFAVFTMVGSLIGVALFRKKLPPAPPQPPQFG
jgi:hypothetical protein